MKSFKEIGLFMDIGTMR